jgi:hypothetical protein
MSTSHQFKATGPSDDGFFTDGDHITFGVNVQGFNVHTGQGCGVYAESLANSPGLRKAQDGSLPGVWGVGDQYGVYGASGKLYQAGPVDNTPLLSPDNADFDAGVNPIGAIGAVGASVDLPGVIGSSGLNTSNTFSREPNGMPQGVVGEIIAGQDGTGCSLGVLGLSTQNFGVAGVNVDERIFLAPGPAENVNAPAQIQSVLSDQNADPQFPTTGAGVFGWSMSGRGGVFGSAAPVVGDSLPATNQGIAQVRLLPGLVGPAADNRKEGGQPEQPLPALPAMGQAGDLIAIVVPPTEPNPQPTVQLWFCIASGPMIADQTPIPDDQAVATWAQVEFSRTLSGDRNYTVFPGQPL